MADGRSGRQSWLEQMSSAGLEPDAPDRPEPRATPWVPDSTMRKFPTPPTVPGVSDLQHRWLVTQGGLVDDPLEAMLGAGRLIGDALQLASTRFSEQRARNVRARRDEGTDTDALRATMLRYRDAFQYVLAADELLDEIEAVRITPPPVETVPEPTLTDVVLEPASAAPMSAADEREVPAASVLTRFGSRRVAAGGLLGLAALAIAFGLWRWTVDGVAPPERRALRVEPLPYRWHVASPPAAARAPLEKSAGTTTTPLARDAAIELVRPDSGARHAAAQAARPAAPVVGGEEIVPALAESETAVAPANLPVTFATSPAAQSPSDLASTSESPPAEVAPPALGSRFSRALEASPPAETAMSSPPIVDAVGSADDPALAAPSSEPIQDTQAVTEFDLETELVPAVASPAPIPEPAPKPVTPLAREVAAAAEAGGVPDAPAAPVVEPGDLVQLGDLGVVPPVLVVEPRAAYPPAAQRLRREALVALRVLVDERGVPERIEAQGQAAGLGFDAAARRAVEDARWRPATKDRVPVKVWVPITVRFQLDGR